MNIKFEDLTSYILTEPNEILKYIQMGINIPIWKEFHEFILHDLQFFKAKSILIKENGNPTGHVLIYDNGDGTLYFGFFATENHENLKILFLLEELIQFAKENGFKSIKGPINIPSIIFGWGFMKKNSKGTLYIGKPVNPPIYQELFLKRGFQIIIEEETWEGDIEEINPNSLKGYDFSDYEYFSPKDWDEILNYKDDFLRIHAQNLPLSSRITPSVENLFENWAKFVLKYGYSFMFMFVRYRPTGKIIGCSSCIPNPFRKDMYDNYDSLVTFSWVVESEHRKKGIGMYMYASMTIQAREKNINYASAPFEKENRIIQEFAKKLNYKRVRNHLILEMNL